MSSRLDNVNELIELALDRASKGDLTSQMQLSQYFETKYELTRDDSYLEKSKSWKQKAIDGGYKAPNIDYSESGLSNMLEKHYSEAINGDPINKVHYAALLTQKAVVTKDIKLLDEAESWLTKAMEQDNEYKEYLDIFVNIEKPDCIEQIQRG